MRRELPAAARAGHRSPGSRTPRATSSRCSKTRDEFAAPVGSLSSKRDPKEQVMTDTRTDDDRSRWIALYVLCAGMLMIVLDITVVNVALPQIADDLEFSQSGLAWVVNG